MKKLTLSLFTLALLQNSLASEHIALVGKGEFAGYKCDLSYDLNGHQISNLKYAGEQKNWQVLFGGSDGIGPGSTVREYSGQNMFKDYFGTVITMHEANNDSFKSKKLKLYGIMNGSFSITIEGDLANPRSFSYKKSAFFGPLKVDQSRVKCNF